MWISNLYIVFLRLLYLRVSSPVCPFEPSNVYSFKRWHGYAIHTRIETVSGRMLLLWTELTQRTGEWWRVMCWH
ncbi:hypothetical protein F4778DRAFT_720404 [Xylariomycetidae sp. FL2044]|nr:hypothetical protein F4778DRAFT_720404 [Xylariomycetidae sp. FL2044]